MTDEYDRIRIRDLQNEVSQLRQQNGGPKRPEYEPTDDMQRLAYLVEECGEVLVPLATQMGKVLAALGKTLRWGPESYNPEVKPADRETNAAWLLRESADLQAALDRAVPRLRTMVEENADSIRVGASRSRAALEHVDNAATALAAASADNPLENEGLPGQHVLAELEHEIHRLRANHCPTMKFGFSPAEIADAVRAELAEVAAEVVGSDRAREESAGVIAVAVHLAIAHGANLNEVLGAEAKRLRARLDHMEGGGTWAGAKELEREHAQGAASPPATTMVLQQPWADRITSAGKHVERAAILRFDQPWSVPMIVDRLVHCADALLDMHNNDRLGWETAHHARAAGIEWLAALGWERSQFVGCCEPAVPTRDPQRDALWPLPDEDLEWISDGERWLVSSKSSGLIIPFVQETHARWPGLLDVVRDRNNAAWVYQHRDNLSAVEWKDGRAHVGKVELEMHEGDHGSVGVTVDAGHDHVQRITHRDVAEAQRLAVALARAMSRGAS